MKNSIKILAAFAMLVCFAFAGPQPERKIFTVVIDTGHGGKDFGSVHGDVREKDIVREVAKKITTLNKETDVVIHALNVDDSFLTLEERVKTINSLKADLVISLHVNAGKKEESSGMEFFVSEKSEHYTKSAELAGKLSQKFKEKEYHIIDVKQAPFFLLKNARVPAIQFQLGYLTNEKDRAYLTNDKSQTEIASLIVDFIKENK